MILIKESQVRRKEEQLNGRRNWHLTTLLEHETTPLVIHWNWVNIFYFLPLKALHIFSALKFIFISHFCVFFQTQDYPTQGLGKGANCSRALWANPSKYQRNISDNRWEIRADTWNKSCSAQPTAPEVMGSSRLCTRSSSHWQVTAQ